MPHAAPDRHSNVAHFELLAAGRSWPVAQIAPEFLILHAPADIPRGPATLIIRVDGNETRRELDLPQGASRPTRRVPIVRP